MKYTGFTLIELITIISIIGLLMAVLLPALHGSREHVKAARCGLNVKQLLFGMFNYETEYQTFPYGFDSTRTEPPPDGQGGNIAFDRAGWWWFNYISQYSTKNGDRKTVLWCPSRQVDNIRLKHYVLHGNYGVNKSICKSSDDIQNWRKEFVGTPLGMSDIPRPGETLLIVDSGYGVISWWHVADATPFPLGSSIEDTAYVPGLWINTDKNLWPGQEVDAIEGRHPNKTINVGFADGHIARPKADDLFVEKTCDSYKNLQPLWKPK
jgi:prepilin-type processing-associated H-X9-DG protein